MKKDTIMTVALIAAIGAGGAFAQGGHGSRDRDVSFETLDQNSDGTISQAELSEIANARFARMDTNSDGMLSKEEILGQASERMAKRVDRMLDRMDADDDGQLSQAEMTARRDPAKIFERMDADKDGAVTEEEFAAAREQGRKRMKDRKNGG